MTAPFPTRKQEEWRYADLDALEPVWEQFAEPRTLTIAAGKSAEEVWLPSADDVQVKRMSIALGAGAKARIFVLNVASVYGRVELDVSLEADAEFELFAANIGDGQSTNEIVTNVRHLGERGRSRQTVRSVLGGKAVGSYLGKVEVARGAQQTDGEQSVKAMLLDRGMAKEALAAYEAVLKKEPNRLAAYMGMMKSAKAAGDQAKTQDCAAQIARLTADSDVSRPELMELRQTTGSKL